MDVQPTDLQASTAMGLEQRVRDDANERERGDERERAEEPRLLIERDDFAPVRGSDPPRAILEPLPAVDAGAERCASRSDPLRPHRSTANEPHDRDKDDCADRCDDDRADQTSRFG